MWACGRQLENAGVPELVQGLDLGSSAYALGVRISSPVPKSARRLTKNPCGGVYTQPRRPLRYAGQCSPNKTYSAHALVGGC